MAATKIYQVGNVVRVDVAGEPLEPLFVIPSRAFRFETEEDQLFIKDIEINGQRRTLAIDYADVQDETGTPVGGKDAVLNYLAPFVGFNPAGGGGGEANTTSNAGAGQGLALPKSGVDLPFKSITAGTGILLTPAANELNIAVTGVVLTTTNQDVDGLKTFLDGQITLDATARGGSDQLLIGYNNTDTFQGWDIRRSSAGGVLKLMSNATFPQLFIGSESNTTGEAYVDVDNNRRLNLNVLDTGAGRPAPTRVGQHGLQIVGINTVVRDSGDLAFLIAGNIIYNTDVNALQYYDGTNWKTFGALQFGEYFMVGNTTATPLTLNTPAKVLGTSTVGEISALFTHSNGRLTYTGQETITVKVDMSISAQRSGGSGSPDYVFEVAKNDAVIAKSGIERDIGAAEAAINIQCLTTLDQNDYIELYCTNVTDGNNILVISLNTNILQIN